MLNKKSDKKKKKLFLIFLKIRCVFTLQSNFVLDLHLVKNLFILVWKQYIVTFLKPDNHQRLQINQVRNHNLCDFIIFFTFIYYLQNVQKKIFKKYEKGKTVSPYLKFV